MATRVAKLEAMSKKELADKLRELLETEKARRSESERLVHELQVHQVELETQNSELREARAALEASYHRYSELYDFAPVAYFTFDAQGVVREVNLAGAVFVGQERANVVGFPFLALVTMQDPSVFWRHLRRCGEELRAVADELSFATKRGGIEARAISAPVLDANGKVAAYRTAFVDLSERNEATRQRRRAESEEALRHQLDEAIRSRDLALAVMAHDLRNPLGTIALSCAAMMHSAPEVERRRDRSKVEHIQRAAEHMRRLIDQLFTATMIESGKFAIQPEPTAVADLVEEAEHVLASLAEAKSVRIEFHVEPVLAPVRCDRDRILQALSNLVGNAVKFSRAGQAIRIEARRRQEWIVFSVADEGPGIVADKLPHIFERYFKGDPGKGGAGLGLYITQGIIAAHGGRIWAESQLGKGSTFSFTLPTVDAANDWHPGAV